MIIIDGIDFENLQAEKYWSFPATYKGDKRQETISMIMSNQYIGARKMDGAHFRFIKGMDGTMRLQGRSESVNGGYLDKYNWVPHLHSWFESIPNGTCLLGELYFPNNEGSRNVTTIMGCLEEKARLRQEKGEKLHYYIFDIWAWDGKSFMNSSAEVRFSSLCALGNTSTMEHPYVEFAKYYYGKPLWDEFVRVRDVGGEGIVITKCDSIPAPGKRTARKTLKIKKELDNPIDCFLTGNYKSATRLYNGDHIEEWTYWQNLHTGEKYNKPMFKDMNEGAPIEPISKAFYYGWASAIEVGLMEEGRIFSFGWISGITEEVKNGIVFENEKWKNRVVKVSAMEIETDTHRMRHGKIIEWRNDGDKKWDECSIEQIL